MVSYMLSRGFNANGRLVVVYCIASDISTQLMVRTTLQHYLWKDGLNYLLHSSIPTTSKNLKIAEIGVGTGHRIGFRQAYFSNSVDRIRLIELAATLPETVQFDGLDSMSTKGMAAKNISLVTQDVFAEPPADLLEKYDIIHVQLFITLIRDGNPVPMLKNLIKMLIGSLAYMRLSLKTVIVDRNKFSTEIVTLLLDTWMMASQEIAGNILDGLGGGQGDVARALIEQVGQNRSNTAFNLQRVVTVGQKPLQGV
ncbi:UMTA methyltransferase family protein [Rutstroemia sp. NJR-2017a BVV2]|nr:UMTA methyltransferase family protein [Rutstroemia sp. NJR-2017a BVV2]